MHEYAGVVAVGSDSVAAGKPAPMADDALTRKDAEMGRLTRKQIENMRSYDPNVEGPLTRKGLRIFQAICDQALSLESVREEATKEMMAAAYLEYIKGRLPPSF